MIKTITPGFRSGRIRIPSSKSVVHRLLVCASLGKNEVFLHFDGVSKDIQATADCLASLGASIEVRPDGFLVHPISSLTSVSNHSLQTEHNPILLPAGESGSTLRFLMPLVGMLGCSAAFVMHGRLSERPLAPYDRLLEEHSMQIRREGTLLHCEGRLQSGDYCLPGNISSQYFSGLLMSLPLLSSDSCLQATGVLESPGYIALTEDALRLSDVRFTREGENAWHIFGGQRPKLAPEVYAEGDWSNAAFFLCIGALSESGVSVSGLQLDSSQGDRAILSILNDFGALLFSDGDTVTVRRGETHPLEIDARDIPDLVPVLAVLCSAAPGTSRITGAARLRFKESDRLRAVKLMIQNLGGDLEELSDGLIIHGSGRLRGGMTEAFNDHRIAMSAAVASVLCSESVVISHAECVDKSYPAFWRDFESLRHDPERERGEII